MDAVFIVSGENKSKAEDVLRKDDVVSRQSISVKLASALGFKEDGFFIVLSGTEDALKKADALLASLAQHYKGKDLVLTKIKEDEDKAIEGFGNILG